jgi:hypothetical protein
MPLTRKILRHEALEERQLLAVDAFGLLADIAHSHDDHDSSCVSSIACCETAHQEETALVLQSHLEETVCYYYPYFIDENYPPVRPMVFDDWVVYDTFSTWKSTVNPEVFQAMRDFF